MGETWEQRLELAYELRELGPDEIPLNFLNPRPGTPLAGRRPLEAHDALRAIAIFRLVFPDRIIRYAGGRELVLRDAQALGLVGGVNGMIVGNYLTTAGRPAAEDMRLARRPRHAVVPSGRRRRRPVNARELLALDRAARLAPLRAHARARRSRSSCESASGRAPDAWPSRSTGSDELVDGMSSWWSAIHGYRHPVARRRRARPARAHEPRDVRRPHPRAGRGPGARGWWRSPRSRSQHVFLCDSGSVSVEVAVKMCLQYWRSRGRPGAPAAAHLAGRLLRRHPHPDVAVRPGRRACTTSGAGSCPRQVFADAPPDGFDAPADPATSPRWPAPVEAHADELAAIIVEPVVQGAGGMRFHSPAYLRALRELADAHDAAAGLRRDRHRASGAPARCSRAEPRRREPRRHVRRQGDDRRLPDDGRHALHRRGWPRASPRGEVPVLAHGPTFMGNPLAAAVANASIDLLLAGDWRGRRRRASRPACGPGSRRRATSPGCRRAGARRDRRGPARPRRSTWRRATPGGGRARRVAAALRATSSTRCRPT